MRGIGRARAQQAGVSGVEESRKEAIVMGWTTKACCDVCGAEKKIANKWLLVFDGSDQHFVIEHWSDFGSKENGVKIICGESCLHRILQPFLDSRTNSTTIAPIPSNEGSTNADIEVSTDAEAVAAAPYAAFAFTPDKRVR